MNILHMKYAVEIAKAGSINKASEALMVAQPNLSRSIKELEGDLGITIFDRSAKGMLLTSEGEIFIGYAKKILAQIDEVESIYKTGFIIKQKFSLAAPWAGYIMQAMAKFSNCISTDPTEIFYEEANSSKIIRQVANGESKLGIVRYASQHDFYVKSMLEEKNLAYELIAEFQPILLMGKENPLIKKEMLFLSDLNSYIEIKATSFDAAFAGEEERKPEEQARRFFLSDSASQLELLAENKETFLWAVPMPKEMMQKYHLTEKVCADSKRTYKDLLIYRKEYRFSNLDQMFITALCQAKRTSI